MLKTKMTAALTVILGGALAVGFYAGGATPASAATTPAHLTACPTSPPPSGGPPPGGGGIAYAKTVAPTNNSTSILIKNPLTGLPYPGNIINTTLSSVDQQT